MKRLFAIPYSRKVSQESVTAAIAFPLILLFAYAAGAKLLEYEQFTAQTARMPLLDPVSAWIAWIIPAVELVTAAMLAGSRFRRSGFYAAFGLMSLFTAYIVLTLLRVFGDIPCSCGGVLSSLDWTEHLLFNILFTLLALAGIMTTLKSKNQPAKYVGRTKR